MIGSLLYLTESRLDIYFSCARYQANLKESYLTFAKRIINYINETLDCGLWYPYDSSLVIVGYFDVDWVENIEDRKNIFGVFFIIIGDCLVAWFSMKQNFVSLSTVEAKHIVVGSCCTQLLWMKQMLKTMELSKTLNIHCDNSSSVTTSKNPILHSCTKLIEIRHHFIKDENVVSLEFVPIKHQLKDILTKPLDFLRFKFLRKLLGICRIN